MAKNSQHARPFYVHIATLFFVLFLVMGCVQLALGFRQHYQSAYAYRIESHSQRSAELGRALQLLQNSGSARSSVAFAKQLSDLLADMNPSGQNRLLLCDSKGQILAATGYGRIPDSSMARSMGTAFQDSLLVHFTDSLSAWNKSQDSNWVLHSSHYGLVIQTLHVTALPGDQQGALYLAQTLPIQALRSEVFYESLRGMRPARNAARPASTASFMACAISTGSRAPAMALFINTPSQPSSIAMAASEGVPTPASTMIGTLAFSTISSRL